MRRNSSDMRANVQQVLELLELQVQPFAANLKQELSINRAADMPL